MKPYFGGMTTAEALEGAKRGAALLKSKGISLSPRLPELIADIIGVDHPDLARLVDYIARSDHPGFAAKAALTLLKAGMPVDVVMGGGLDAASRLSRAVAIEPEVAAELIVTTVNAFGLGPKYLPAIPNYIANIRYR